MLALHVTQCVDLRVTLSKPETPSVFVVDFPVQSCVVLYSGVCYNERILQQTVVSNKIRMIQQTVFSNKIRMLQQTVVRNKIRMLQQTVFRNKIRMLQQTVVSNKIRMLQQTRRNIIYYDKFDYSSIVVFTKERLFMFFKIYIYSVGKLNKLIIYYFYIYIFYFVLFFSV
jgi:hypothetical protein